jgi:S-adenosylmethionine-diacylglycerol 3-amino-3-carboxypropyl transferase
MRVLTEPSPRERAGESISRLSLPGAIDDRLYFAQVREDPLLEIEALAPGADDSLVVVGSGGCTALSLVAAGAGRVASVDLNRSQNHLVELKLAAVTSLPHAALLGALGASRWPRADRVDAYAGLRARLSPAACDYWDARRSAIERGVLDAGVTERFIRGVVAALQLLVHPRSRIERLLACASIDEQRELFDREWDTLRWRAFFRILLNRVVFHRAYDPAFFAHLEQPSFAAHFRSRAEYTLTRLSVRDNYFLHQMLTGVYPADDPDGVPPYLSDAGCRAISDASDALTLVDGSVTEYLKTLPDASVSGFALSNICEWLTPAAIDELFAQVARTARPEARLCFRNFVGWTEVPDRWRTFVVEDRAFGERLIARDRSVVQRRIAVCRVNSGERQ